MPLDEKKIHTVFVWSVALKGINALFEIFLGIALLFTKTISNTVGYFVQKELIEDPKDFLALQIQNTLFPYLAHSEMFVSVYLLSHGVIKLFLTWGLLKEKIWAYPTSIVFLWFFILYQLFRFTHTHSLFLIALTVFDLAVVGLVWHEYVYLKSKKIH